MKKNPPSNQVLCIRHISENFVRKFKDNISKKKIVAMDNNFIITFN